ncbi:MAG: beta-lactamase family protein [Tannerellaceae bacterium]|jgi:CubicO group peptidase (beta-lactamase class C family)|nr:beta-lactamase family protein [Tannerellaceae bacterium]
MKKIYIFITFLLAIGSVSISCKQTKKESVTLVNSIDSLLAANSTKPFNGIVLIAKEGKTEYLKMTGFSDFDTKTPFKIDDPFVVGSVSKQFTAAVVLQEYDNGRLDLHAPIRTYLPDLSESWVDTVTIHHLLTHTHGIVSLDKPTLFPVRK